LSVPQSWGGVPAAAEQAAPKLVSANFVNGSPVGPNGAPANALLNPGVMGARGTQRAGNMGVRYGFRYNVLTRPPSAG